MAISDYASIRTEVNLHAARAYSVGQVDTFIGLFEADATIWLGPNYARETSTTVVVASGSGSLPSGFIRPISLSHATYGVLDMKSRDALIAYNPTSASGIPTQWAIEGSGVYVAYALDANYTLHYEGAFSTLVAGAATTNWLIEKAPQTYFWGVMAQSKAFEEDYEAAGIFSNKAKAAIDALVQQSMVAQFSRASLKMRGPTP
jgi:hypothetical protein